jgi:kinesin family protein 5
VLLDVNPIV